jgi:nicotinate-nucleotide adenylyltransferase
VGKNIGIFGGTFDPIHYGHLIMAEQCREQAGLEELIFVPAAQSPLKSNGPIASARHRVEMLRLATAGHESFSVDTLELDRPGPSYTIDTLRALQARGESANWFFVLGSDALRDFAQWREPAEILDLAKLLVVARPGQSVDLDAVRPLVTADKRREIEATQIQGPLVDISSSDIRQRISQGRSIRYLTPRAVEVYVRTHSIYRAAA